MQPSPPIQGRASQRRAEDCVSLTGVKLTLEQLPSHLAGRLLPVYLVAGDDPLLCGEALDAIRLAARRDGFEERLQVFIERSAARFTGH